MKQYFKGKNIFITGATGFLGKIFLEKLLQASPNKCYLLIRPKKGTDSNERMTEYFSNSLVFSNLKSKFSGNDFQKYIQKHIKIIDGDMSKPYLGISNSDREEIIKNIDIVYNIGASVSWASDINEMLDSNTKSALYVLDIAKQANVEHFIHISTFAAPRPIRLIYDEKIFGENFDFIEYIHMVDSISNKEDIKNETNRISKNFGNAYSFTKAGAEVLIKKYHDKIPTTIMRAPSLGPALYDPAPGWVDIVTGYTGNLFYIGLGKSLAYIVNKSNLHYEMPVDIYANYMICAKPSSKTSGNSFNEYDFIPKSDITSFSLMERAYEYFKENPVNIDSNGKVVLETVKPVFFEDKAEFDKYLDKLSMDDSSPNMQKAIERTRYFNKLYFNANSRPRDLSHIPTNFKTIIDSCSEEDLKEYPLLDMNNFDFKKYVDLSCYGLRKYMMKPNF